jgi:hypothetical protein
MARKPKKNPAAVELGRLGGKARLKKITPERRSEIARSAAVARWANGRKDALKDRDLPESTIKRKA